MFSILFFLLLFGSIMIGCHYVYYKITYYEKTITVKHKYTINANDIKKDIIVDIENNEYLIDNTIWYNGDKKVNPNFFEETKKYKICGYGINLSVFNLATYIIDVY